MQTSSSPAAPSASAPQTPSAPPAPASSTPQARAKPGQAGTIDTPSLRAQLGDLNVQLAALKAEWRGLQNQLNTMRLDNPARAGVQQKAADIGVQIAKVQGDIARLQAQIDQREGGPGTLVPPPVPRGRGFDPDLAAGLMFAFIFAVLMPISIAMARRLWRGRPPAAPMTDPSIAPRLDRIEQAVDAVAIEIERVSEGQRFVTKILAERPANDGSSIRALGAGPAEPIQTPEREAMRQQRNS
ncbi:MAG TPA: hypothetical protein VN706_04425 [Gemmatimonadaceae bacterium]|nr:hypothetical protein [Gemmatimonadaceae bacterium]